jgi:hypothetical protein
MGDRMARLKLVDDPGVAVRRWAPWDNAETARQLQAILEATEAPPIDEPARMVLQRYLWRRNKYGDLFRDEWGKDGAGYITLLIRTIIESAGNENALIEPVIVAVSLCMRPQWTSRGLAWIEAFDQVPLIDTLNKLRELDLFSDGELADFYARSIRNRISKILDPGAQLAKAKKVYAQLPRALTRVPEVERDIAFGLDLLGLKAKIKDRFEFGRQMRQRFDAHAKIAGVARASAGPFCAQAQSVARSYGARPEIFSKVSWRALVLLSSPSLPPAARADLERRILAGEKVVEDHILAARGKRTLRSRRREAQVEKLATGARKAGKRQAEQPARRMAA